MLCCSLGGWSVPGHGPALFLQGIPHSQLVPLLSVCGTVVLVWLFWEKQDGFHLGNSARSMSHHDFINIPKSLSLLFCLNSDTQWWHRTTEAYESSAVQNHNNRNTNKSEIFSYCTLRKMREKATILWRTKLVLYHGELGCCFVIPDKLQHVKTCYSM